MRDAAHRRQHCCANINDLACSGFNLHLAAVGMMAVRAVVYCCAVLCCAVLCCAVLLLPLVLLVYASTEVTKNVVSLPESVPESYEQKIKDVLGQKKCPRVNFGKQYIYHAGCQV